MKLIYRYLCLALGALLGTGCDNNSGMEVEYGPPIPEYGVPTGSILVSGVVQNAEGEGIPGIEIQLAEDIRDTTTILGRFSIERQGIYLFCMMGTELCQVQARDIDGAANGSYADAIANIDLQQTAPGQNDWDLGSFVDENVNIVMDPQRKAGPRAE